ncbi:MAG TPA: SigE family RNA polymerase sigma factor [Mycobacteriales bacterium]|nr:SigE family RNA polymerase sigma factor [Mycobacteriales bacterium]
MTQTEAPAPSPPRTFEEYAAERQAALIRFGYLLVRDHHLAQDLAQEGLAALHRRWHFLRVDGSPDAYVRKVMVNELLSWRRRRSWSERPVPELREDSAQDPTTAVSERAQMWALIATLPMRQRAVVVLRYYEDLDDPAIAAILGCGVSTVATHAARALARLRTIAPAPLSEGIS